MYDMKADPREMNNVFGKPEYAKDTKRADGATSGHSKTVQRY